jgi:hypothetical protein
VGVAAAVAVGLVAPGAAEVRLEAAEVRLEAAEVRPEAAAEGPAEEAAAVREAGS